jgi:hypothetical protein
LETLGLEGASSKPKFAQTAAANHTAPKSPKRVRIADFASRIDFAIAHGRAHSATFEGFGLNAIDELKNTDKIAKEEEFIQLFRVR